MTWKQYKEITESEGYYIISYITKSNNHGEITIKKMYYDLVIKKINRLLKNCYILQVVEKTNEEVEYAIESEECLN